MKNYLVAVSKAFKLVYPELIWEQQREKSKTIYLTFDDGPTPEVTDWVLDFLAKHKIQASFFCIGKNIENHPAIFNRILEGGHRIGNHTQNHLNGWNTKTDKYLKDIEEAARLIPREQGLIFRPPYGRIRKKQIRALKNQAYKIIMWTALSADWDAKNTPQVCIDNCLKNSKDGSILVFHDSVKAQKNLYGSLETVIMELKNRGFEFKTL
ncbi:polysaccharide deacetylase family protein [Flavobacteriaceae bacterium]|nr:polysaccharide deacetylase family protein [Flavobacteriaceae bacterium]